MYNEAVHQIKTAILQSQSKALASVNQEQLALYYGIGRYISQNSRLRYWGKDAIETISRQLSIELPGIKGFSARNLRNMRTFYEKWKCFDTDSTVATDEIQKSVNLAVASAKLGSEYNTASINLSAIGVCPHWYKMPNWHLEQLLLFLERRREVDVGERSGIGKERGNFLGRVACYSAAYGCDQEGELGMGFCEGYEALYGLSGAGQALHCGYSVGSALQALAVTPFRSEMVQCISGRPTRVVAELVGAEYKYLPGLQSADMFGGYSLVHIGW